MKMRVIPLIFLLSLSRVLGAPFVEKEAPPQEIGKLPFTLVRPDEEKGDPVASKQIEDEPWAQTLFGEKGILTGLFHVIDERRRGMQADAIDKINGKPLDLDFAKIFDSLLMGSEKAQFGDPSPELPEFLGICNRLSCGDIYKAIEQFRRSEFFSNFQTALQLIQDPKGWNIIGDLLSNPELIASFTSSAGGLDKVFGSAIASKAKSVSKPDITPEDGDIGTDFSEIAEKVGSGKPLKPGAEQLPETAFSIDGLGEAGGSDYYSQVNKEAPDVDIEEPFAEGEVVQPAPPPPSSKEVPSRHTKKEEPLPLTSLSIDETSEGETFEKTVDVEAPVDRVTSVDAKSRGIGLSGKMVVPLTTTTASSTSVVTTTTSTAQPPTSTTTLKRVSIPFIFTTTTLKPTTRNARRDNDYYAMYYDDVQS